MEHLVHDFFLWPNHYFLRLQLLCSELYRSDLCASRGQGAKCGLIIQALIREYCDLLIFRDFPKCSFHRKSRRITTHDESVKEFKVNYT